MCTGTVCCLLAYQNCDKDISIQALASGNFSVRVCDFGYATNAHLPLRLKHRLLGGPSQMLDAPKPTATLTL